MMTYDLDTSLMELADETGFLGHWTLRNAFEGVQIFGGIGSGKTSGSGRMIALKFLKNGFGGLVLTVKPDEKDLWVGYCALAGRSDDLLIVEPGQDNYFNFLDYESSQGKSGVTENIVQVLKTVIRASNEKGSGQSDDAFWENALDMLIFNVIDLCKLAYNKVSIQLMYDIVQSLPEAGTHRNASDEQTVFEKTFELARTNVTRQTDAWDQEQNVEFIQQLQKNNTYEETLYNAIPELRLLRYVDQFLNDSYKNLNEKTRSIVQFSFSGFLFRLLRDPVYSLFCNHASTFTPEDCLEGKIILLNLPVKLYQKIGRDCQILFKYIWQRAMEKRRVNAESRPLFLWADEAQNFLHEHDADYQATARSSMIATVYISQNLPNYHANMGGGKSEFKVKSFLGTLATKIFHANADIETNRYASELIGDDSYQETSRTTTKAEKFSSSKTKAMKIDKMVRPEAFSILKTGGPNNDYLAECFIHLQGNVLKNGQNHINVHFDQNCNP